MQEPAFEYDVFLSFSAADEESVRTIWQQLTLNGLRVFWSDSSLRERAGSSWFEVIQDALSRSRHLVFVCTPASLASKWVKREYVAFFTHQYSPPARLFIPVLGAGVRIADLPLFLREIEVVSLEEPDAPRRLVRVLGGVDVEGLRLALARRDEELALLRHELSRLQAELTEVRLVAGRLTDASRPTLESNHKRASEHSTTTVEQKSTGTRVPMLDPATNDPPPLRLVEEAVVKYFREIGEAAKRDPTRALFIGILITLAVLMLVNASR